MCERRPARSLFFPFFFFFGEMKPATGSVWFCFPFCPTTEVALRHRTPSQPAFPCPPALENAGFVPQITTILSQAAKAGLASQLNINLGEILMISERSVL